MNFKSTKILELGSCAFRQPNAAHNRGDAGENSKRCSFIHGYKLTAKFWFGCSSLDDKNWVQDFGGFKSIKDTFKHQFDHTTCLSADDPLLPLFKQLHDAGGLDLRVMEKGTGIERIAEFCYIKMQEHVNSQSKGRVWVDKVEVFEHENNSAIYEPQPAAVQGIVSEQEVKQIEQQVQAVQQVHNAPTPAPVGNAVTSGKGNWFAGTTWG